MDLIATPTLDLAVGLHCTGDDTTGGPLNDALVRLYAASIDISDTTTLATLNADSATYQGYGDGTITWNTPSVNEDGLVEVIGTMAIFRPTGDDSPNNIWGLYVIGADTMAPLLLGEFNEPPIPMVDASSLIQITLRWRPNTTGVAAVVS